jgi:sugar/nucleoside kinase (ribokinase family)
MRVDENRLRVDWGVEGGSRFVFAAGSGTYHQATPTPDELPVGLVAGLEAVHVAPIPLEQMEAWVRWARARARVVTVDPHYQHLHADWAQVLPLVDAFLPSRAEAIGILGGWPGTEAAARSLAALGARIVCIKLGAEGAIACHGATGEAISVPAATLDPVDPTGCGDAFCGGFLVGLTEAGDLHAALAHGAEAAARAGRGHGVAHARL